MKVNQQQRKKIDTDERGNPLMTLKTIKYYCSKDSLFQTPQLNQKLYLHYKGFKKIQSLQHYPNLITIWLNNNCLTKISGLATLNKLICLYLNYNSISKIQNLQTLDQLSILHLAHNKIDKVEGLTYLKSLNILNLAENFISTPQSILGLQQSSTLTSLDLSKNQLQSTQELFTVISSLPNISSLTLKNTPFSRTFKSYRKNLIAHLKNLKYLDDRPVQDTQHRLAQAWLSGGPQLQNQQRIKISNELSQKNQRESLQLATRITRQKLKQQQISQLQRSKKQLQSHHQTQQTHEQLLQIKQKLQHLKQGPKAFHALVTKTQIKIFNINKQQQSDIINKYFYNQKIIIENNLKILSESSLPVETSTSTNQQKQIQNKVYQLLNINPNQQPQHNNPLNQNYLPILQSLLIKYKYNFQLLLPQFNNIISNINLKLFRIPCKFNQKDLQYIWTNVQIKKRSTSKIC